VVYIMGTINWGQGIRRGILGSREGVYHVLTMNQGTQMEKGKREEGMVRNFKGGGCEKGKRNERSCTLEKKGEKGAHFNGTDWGRRRRENETRRFIEGTSVMSKGEEPSIT